MFCIARHSIHLRQILSIFILVFCCGCQTNGPAVNVTDFGAVGDGKTLCTEGFQKALDAASARGGEVVVPAGDFLIGSIVMKSNTTLRLEKGAILTGSLDPAHYPLMQVRWEGRWREGHRSLIYSEGAQNIAIVGDGTINGDMRIGDLRNPRGPCIFEPVECRNVRIEGIRVNYRRMWAIHLTYCEDVFIAGMTIRSVRNNGDGIDVDSCRNVRIEKCDILTGDDAIALKSGRGMEGVRIGRPTENVIITDCRLGSDFAGLAIGTEMSGGIRNVRFSNCTFTRGANGVYVKSRSGRGGFIEDIEGRNSNVAGARTFLCIDLMTKGIQDSEPVEGIDGLPRASDIRIHGVHGQCQTLLDARNIAREKPLQRLTFTDADVNCKQAIVMHNIQAAELRNISAHGFEGALITAENTTKPSGEPLTAP